MSRPRILSLDEGQQRDLLAELSEILCDLVFAAGPEVDLAGDVVLTAAAHGFGALGVIETDGETMRLALPRSEVLRRVAEAPVAALPLPVDLMAIALYVSPADIRPDSARFVAPLDAVLDALGMVAGPWRVPDATLRAMLIDLSRVMPPGGEWTEDDLLMILGMARALAESAPPDVPGSPGSDPDAAARLTEAIRTRSRCGHWLTAAELERPAVARPWGVLPQLMTRAIRGLPL